MYQSRRFLGLIVGIRACPALLMFQTCLQRRGIDHEQQVVGINGHAARRKAHLVLRVVALLKDRAIVAHAP